MPELNNASPVREGLQTWINRWRRLSADSRSIVIVALLAALVAAAIVTILWTSSRDFVPLYGKQELYDTAAILEVLESEGIEFRLDDRSGQVMVTKDKVASARMKLAARGVSAQLPDGIDSLNNLSSVSTSQFMETNRYTHAVEGELARTIMTLDGVRNVRVHLAIPKRTLFVGREELTPTASVMLDLSAPLDESQVESIVNLIAGSVPGMKPGAVSVVDQKGRLLSAGLNSEDPSRVSSKQMDYVSQLEARIGRRASDMLEPLLGSSNFRIRVAADVDFSKVEETREVLDPQTILLSESTVLDNATDQLALGIPGALANQPPIANTDAEEDEENAGNNAQQAVSRREETSRRYSTGKAVTHTQFDQGRLRKLSVSVLVNDAVGPEGGWTQAQLDNMAEMVQTAVGYVAERGDTLTLKNAPFVVPDLGFTQPVETPWWNNVAQWENYIRYALGSLLLFLLIIFGIRPLVKHLTRREQPALATVSSSQPDPQPVLEEAQTSSPRALGKTDTRPEELEMPSLPPPGSELEVQLKHLRLLVDKETTRVAEVIKTWVQDSGRTSN